MVYDQLLRFIGDIYTLAIVCAQWGDTGKGKLVDICAPWADIIARGTGGANAGHTIRIGEKEFVLHLVPSGILHHDKLNVIGNGVVVDPGALISEIDALIAGGVLCDNLRIAYNAKLVLPQHIVMDKLSNSVGTTGRGIGPAYVDHYARRGLTMNDLLNPDTFVRKFRANLSYYHDVIRGMGVWDKAQTILQDPKFGNGKFYSSGGVFDYNAIIEYYLACGKRLADMITDTDYILRTEVGKKKILLEGAQGNLLSVDYGTYPYVTSSDPSIYGLARGVGLTAEVVDRTISIAKAPYMTRVGGGPFPTEMGGETSAEWCARPGITREVEKKEFPAPLLGAGKMAPIPFTEPDFRLGVAIRQAGNEYGATTGRLRRTGWFDVPLLRYGRKTFGRHGNEVALTKLDVMSTCPVLRICDSYTYEGPDYRVGDLTLTKGYKLRTAIPNADVLSHCRPVYREVPGWMCDISGIRKRSDLPGNLTRYIEVVEALAGVSVSLLSVGPDREQTIFL
jgi:adenylosuccinate synthase